MIWIGFCSVVVLICWCLLEVGYQAGVRETERRWSETVKRMEKSRDR